MDDDSTPRPALPSTPDRRDVRPPRRARGAVDVLHDAWTGDRRAPQRERVVRAVFLGSGALTLLCLPAAVACRVVGAATTLPREMALTAAGSCVVSAVAVLFVTQAQPPRRLRTLAWLVAVVTPAFLFLLALLAFLGSMRAVSEI